MVRHPLWVYHPSDTIPMLLGNLENNSISHLELRHGSSSPT